MPGISSGYSAQLSQQPQRIPVEPAFLDLPIPHSMNIDRRDHYRFARRGNPGKFTLVDGGGVPAGDKVVTLGHLIVDGEI